MYWKCKKYIKNIRAKSITQKTETADSLKNFIDADKTLARETKIRKDTVREVRHQTQLPHLTRGREIIKACTMSITMGKI